MKTHVHLVSTFGPNAVLQPSIQLAVLEAHLARASVPGVDVTTHASFASVAWRAWPDDAPESVVHVTDHGEYAFALLCLADLEPALLRAAGVTEGELLRRVRGRSAFRHVGKPLGWEDLDRLRAAAARDLDQRFRHGLPSADVHLWGFTLDFSQVFSSAYFMRRVLERFPGARHRVVVGGAAASLPDTARALDAMKLRAWCVEGEGELKLEAMARALAALPGDADDAAVNAALSGAGAGVRRMDARVSHVEEDALERQVPRLETLPLPTFDGFFREVEALRAEGITALRDAPFVLPMEGSRGCFASCVFCSNPHSWSGYRKMHGEEVLHRTTELFRRYPFTSVTYVDVVCDTWATHLADALLRTGATLPSVMCFRAHHPEAFFTRMALSGLEHVQVGVEALSPPLLAAMEKGTRVHQNILAQKFLAELRVRQWNNLITHHPGSTRDDIRETMRILELTPHLGAYGLSPLSLRAGSPLWDRAMREGHVLSREWAPGDERFPPLLEVFDDTGVQRAPPRAWLDEETARAWSEFEDWYDAFARDHVDATCDVLSLPGGRLRVVDAREGDTVVTVLTGLDARVLDACHAGPTADELCERLRADAAAVGPSLSRLLEARLLLETEGRFIALPLRARDVLVRAFMKTPQRRLAVVGEGAA